SGLDAVNFAAAEVMSGQHDMTVGGGVESMSRVGIGASGGAWPVDPAIALKSYFLPQGISADLIATKYGFSRDDVDAYAVESQKRAAAAWDGGHFNKSVLTVRDVNGITLLAKDEHMRPATTMQSLAALQPSFVQIGEFAGFDAVAVQAHPEIEAVSHVHHAGNSSGIVDGAAAVLIGNKAAGKAAGLKPRARIKAFANIGPEPAIRLTGPIDVTNKVLKRAGMKLKDIDLIEVNEAFASVVLRYLQAFRLDPAKVNVNGGAIAMGHPLGATGAMILGTALDELERRGLSTALVTLCIGGGMGTATITGRGSVRRLSSDPAAARPGPPHKRGERKTEGQMPKIDIDKIAIDTRIGYPEPYRRAVEGRERKRLGNAVGLDQFGVNLSRLKPGAASSQRHWHHNEDEFIYVLEGELVLVEDSGEAVLKPGDAAGWKAGVANGHCLITRTHPAALYLEIGSRAPRETAEYPDIDMRAERDGKIFRYLHKSGAPYPGSER